VPFQGVHNLLKERWLVYAIQLYPGAGIPRARSAIAHLALVRAFATPVSFPDWGPQVLSSSCQGFDGLTRLIISM
jgi:hypothetical protein